MNGHHKKSIQQIQLAVFVYLKGNPIRKWSTNPLNLLFRSHAHHGALYVALNVFSYHYICIRLFVSASLKMPKRQKRRSSSFLPENASRSSLCTISLPLDVLGYILDNFLPIPTIGRFVSIFSPLLYSREHD